MTAKATIFLPAKLTHCPNCGIAMTVEATVRVRSALPEEEPPPTAEEDSDG